MHDFIVTYVTLLIAMISFVAPVMLFLLSIFSHGIAIVKRKAEEEDQQIQKLLTSQLQNNGSNVDLITKSSQTLTKNKKKNADKINLLNPKRQIIRVYAWLFSSLACVMADMLLKDKSFKLYNHYVCMGLMFGSFILLVVSLLILLQVGWEIIDTKAMIAEEETAVKLGKEVELKKVE